MKTITWILCLVFSQYILADSITLQDIECKVMGGNEKILIKPGILYDYICDSNNKDVLCIHMANDGEPTIDKYIISFNDGKTQTWQSLMKNTVISLDHPNSKFTMGFSYFSAAEKIIITKYCIGKIKKDSK